jgi:protein-tyrosine-phosphatase
MTIVFVCSQNKLRSVVGSESLRARRADLTIESGGIPKEGRKFGCKANKRVREIIQSRYGVDLSVYRSKALTKEMIERADRIFVFSKHNREKLVKVSRPKRAQSRKELSVTLISFASWTRRFDTIAVL